MPSKNQKSSLAARLGKKGQEALEEHKDDETKISAAGDLPAGVSGTARVVEIKFSEYENGDNKGKPFYYSHATVLTPAAHAGLYTKVGPIPLCDTKKRDGTVIPMSDRLSNVLNELRKMGADTTELEDLENLESIVETLKEEGPVIKFRTWSKKATKQQPDPFINHVWSGLAEDEEGTEGEATEDVEEAEDGVEEAAEEEEAVDWAALGKVADMKGKKGAKEAAEQIEAKFDELELGDIEKVKDWKTAAKKIETKLAEEEPEADADGDGDGGGEEAEEAAEETPEPEKGGTCQYKLLVKGKLKKVECTITAVYKKAEKVDLKNIDDGKSLYKGVPWAKIELE